MSKFVICIYFYDIYFFKYYQIHEKLGQQNVVVMSTFQKYYSVTFLNTLF
jgi:hypothetical protein